MSKRKYASLKAKLFRKKRWKHYALGGSFLHRGPDDCTILKREKKTGPQAPSTSKTIEDAGLTRMTMTTLPGQLKSGLIRSILRSWSGKFSNLNRIEKLWKELKLKVTQ